MDLAFKNCPKITNTVIWWLLQGNRQIDHLEWACPLCHFPIWTWLLQSWCFLCKTNFTNSIKIKWYYFILLLMLTRTCLVAYNKQTSMSLTEIHLRYLMLNTSWTFCRKTARQSSCLAFGTSPAKDFINLLSFLLLFPKMGNIYNLKVIWKQKVSFIWVWHMFLRNEEKKVSILYFLLCYYFLRVQSFLSITSVLINTHDINIPSSYYTLILIKLTFCSDCVVIISVIRIN